MPAGRRKRGDPRRRRFPRPGRHGGRWGRHIPHGRRRRPDDDRSRRQRRKDRKRDRKQNRRSRREQRKVDRKLRKRRWRRKERKARRKQARKDRKHRRHRRIRRLLLLPLVLLFLMMSCTSLTTMAVMSAIPDPTDLLPDIDLSALGELLGFGGGGPNVLGSTSRYTESMITATTQRMLDTVIPLFGQGYGVGCYRQQQDGEHPRGRACDFIMARPLNTMPTPEYLAHGWAFCNFLIAHAADLHVRYIIWQKRIWFPGSGWEAYTRYDGVTQGELLRLNHYDHVHVSLNWVEGDRVI